MAQVGPALGGRVGGGSSGCSGGVGSSLRGLLTEVRPAHVDHQAEDAEEGHGGQGEQDCGLVLADFRCSVS